MGSRAYAPDDAFQAAAGDAVTQSKWATRNMWIAMFVRNDEMSGSVFSAALLSGSLDGIEWDARLRAAKAWEIVG